MFCYNSNSETVHQSATNCYNNKSSQLSIVMFSYYGSLSHTVSYYQMLFKFYVLTQSY